VLTISPGVIIKFNDVRSFYVRGGMIADGTEDEIITFTSNNPSPTVEKWARVYFTRDSIGATVDQNKEYTGGSILRHCKFQYGGFGQVGQISIQGNSPYVSNVVSTHGHHGIHYDSVTNVVYLINSTFDSNNRVGIKGSGSITTSWIENCSASGNVNMGIEVRIDGVHTFINVTSNNNNNHGIAVEGGSYTFNGCTMYNNNGYGEHQMYTSFYNENYNRIEFVFHDCRKVGRSCIIQIWIQCQYCFVFQSISSK
jgi:hypothetical protein